MKLFEVKKGAGAIVCTKPCHMTGREDTEYTHINELFVTRKDLCFDREELLVDPISLVGTDTFALCKELEYKGYCSTSINSVMNNAKKCMVFERDGYLLIVDVRLARVL